MPTGWQASTQSDEAGSQIEELLARATHRVVVNPGDARSGSRFERLVIDGDPYFLKSFSPASDWITRVMRDTTCRPLQIWQHGLMDRVPASVDHAVAAMALRGDGDDAVLSILMRDIGPHLIPEGDDRIDMRQHAGFMAALADLSATFWAWEDDIGLTTMTNRLLPFAPETIVPELAVDDVPGPIAAADRGWRELAERCPRLFESVRAIHSDPQVLAPALEELPATFLHGDWKMGNLGMHPDGRTILIDWAYPGAGPPCWDLFWYLALNRARLPESKEDAVERLRRELEARHIETSGWWELSVDLCSVGVMSTFAWEKALGDEAELAWWDERVAAALDRLSLDLG